MIPGASSEEETGAPIPTPVRTDFIWGVKDIKKARELLRVKYPHAVCDEATVLSMIADLVQAHRYDYARIEQVILEHFTELKKKGRLQL